MALADVVLPAATYAERDGFGGLNPYRLSCINKAVEPVGESKPDNTIFLELGKRLTDAIRPQNNDIAYPWETVEEMWDYALALVLCFFVLPRGKDAELPEEG